MYIITNSIVTDYDHMNSLSLHYGPFDWSYFGIRIRKSFNANLFYRDFWAIQTLHTLEYFISSTFRDIAMHYTNVKTNDF